MQEDNLHTEVVISKLVLPAFPCLMGGGHKQAGLAGGLVLLVSLVLLVIFMGVQEEGLQQRGNIRAGSSHVYTSFQMSL